MTFGNVKQLQLILLQKIPIFFVQIIFLKIVLH